MAVRGFGHAAALLALIVLLVAGCAAPEPARPSTAPSTPGQISAPTLVPLAQSCVGIDVPAGIRQETLAGPDGSTLAVAWSGTGTSTAVLLHQTDGNGLCGFLSYADYLARRGVRVVAVDICGYGQSVCSEALAADPIAQVEVVVGAARAVGARRVTLVGASMGGSLAIAAGPRVRADAIVDLSGPARFQGFDITRDAKAVTVPILIAFGSATDPSDLAAVKAELPAMPSARKQLVVLPTGHGYDLLHEQDSTKPTKLAAQVRDWVVG